MGKKLTAAAIVAAIALFLADAQTAALLESLGISAVVSAKVVGVGKLVTAFLAAFGESPIAAPKADGGQ